MILRGTQLVDSRQSIPAVHPVDSDAQVKKSTLASNVAFADDVNRSPSKHQSAMNLHDTSRAHSTARDDVAEEMIHAGTVSGAAVLREEQSPSSQRALTFESVVAWLAVQDQETKNDCAAILATEVAATYEKAKSEGIADGKQLALAAMKDQLAAALASIKSISDAAEIELASQSSALEAMTVEVITEAITKIAGPLLSTQEAAIGAVREILRRVREGRELIIRVSNTDLEWIRRWQGSLIESFGGRKIEIVADGRVELGGALVENKLGSLDGRFEVQLRELYETLRLAKTSLAQVTNDTKERE